MTFLSLKTFKIVYKNLNKHVREIHGAEFCPLPVDQYKPIIGNAMEEIETKYMSKNINEKRKMCFYICKKIVDKNLNTREVANVMIMPEPPREIITQQPVDEVFNRIMDSRINNLDENKSLLIKRELNKPIQNLFVTQEEVEHLIDPEEKLKSFQEQIIIPIDEFNKNKPIKKLDLVIDSRDRNYDDHPDPQKYSILLNEPIHNVISIDLKIAVIPNSEYIINITNNLFYFEEASGTILVATITEGNYTETELIAELQSQLNIDGNSTYAVSNMNGYVKIISDLTGVGGLFNVIIENKNNSIHSILGYNDINLSSASNYTADNKILLENETDIFLHLKGFDNIETVSNEVGDNFAKLELTSEKGSYTYLKGDNINQKHFTDIPKKLHKINIQFYKNNGELYDFVGMEHSLLMEISHYNFDNFYHG